MSGNRVTCMDQSICCHKQLGNKRYATVKVPAGQSNQCLHIFAAEISLVVFCDWSEKNLNHKIVQVLTENGKQIVPSLLVGCYHSDRSYEQGKVVNIFMLCFNIILLSWDYFVFKMQEYFWNWNKHFAFFLRQTTTNSATIINQQTIR